jgi:hypothetical protein
MKRVGNAESNKIYNPRNQKAQIPIDVDEVDGAMERYIRQKYEQRTYMAASAPGTRHNTGSTSSDDRPPPLPPKPSGRFGFGLRKASISRSFSPPVSPNLGDGEFGQNMSPPRVNKPSRVFGSNIQTSGDGMDSKLSTLRDMGFPDEKRNSTVLKGLNGNLDRAVEALIRLGEQNTATSRGGTPTPPPKPTTNGISFDNPPSTSGGVSFANPFDALDAAPIPQQPTQQPNGGAAQLTAQANSYNPFFSQSQQGQQGQQAQYQQQSQYQQQGQYQQQAAQQQQQSDYGYQNNPFGQVQGQQPQARHQSLEQSFQGMQLSGQQQQQPQQLFPNRTGGFGQTPNAPFAQTNPFQQSFTPPPMPQISEQFSSYYAPQPQYQSMSSPSSPGNPFLKSSRSQMFTPTHSLNNNPFGQTFSQQPPQQQQQLQQNQQASNPWTQQQTQTPVSQTANPWQAQTQPYQQPQASTSQAPNPWQTQPQQPQQPQQQQQQQQQQQYNHAQPGFQGNPSPFDKSSILSLYNQPQAASAAQGLPRSQTMPALGTAVAPAVPMQAPGHMNPFGAQSAQPTQPAQPPVPTRHVSNESVDFAGLMGGRHSPDAFSGLSASYRR